MVGAPSVLFYVLTSGSFDFCNKWWFLAAQVEDDGALYIVDWDALIFATKERERDVLQFVVFR